MLVTAANAVTVSRVLAIPLFVALVLRAHAQPSAMLGWWAGLVFALAAASDVLDGRLARRAGSASNAGRFLDHLADIGFILSSLATYVVLDKAPWWVPGAIALSFGFYLFDSLRRTPRAPSLIGSRLGHWGGVANYVLIGVLVFNESAAIGWLPDGFMRLLFATVPLYSLGAIAARLASPTG